MSRVTSLESLVNGSHPAAEILVERDPVSGMARVTVNGRLVMEDMAQHFNPSRLGGWHHDLAERQGTWISPETLAVSLARALGHIPDGCIIRSGIYMSGR